LSLQYLNAPLVPGGTFFGAAETDLDRHGKACRGQK
jgi:hypothetical protein